MHFCIVKSITHFCCPYRIYYSPYRKAYNFLVRVCVCIGGFRLTERLTKRLTVCVFSVAAPALLRFR